MLIAPATNVLAALAIDNDEGRTPYKVMANTGPLPGLGALDFSPRWLGLGAASGIGLDRPGALLGNKGRHAYAFPAAGSTTLVGVGGWSFGLVASVAALTDAAGNWLRADTLATTNANAGVRHTNTNGGFRSAHRPFFQVRVRFGPVITATRFVFAFFTSYSDIGNSDDFGALTGGIVGLRYSTVAGDTGFTPFSGDATAGSQIVGAAIGTVVASATYLLSIFIDDLTTTVLVDDGTTTVHAQIGTPDAIASNTSLSMGSFMAVTKSTDGASKLLDFGGVYSYAKFRP